MVLSGSKNEMVKGKAAPRLVLLNHRALFDAKRIQEVFYSAYSVEARLLGIDCFPPLSRKIEDFQKSDSKFWGLCLGQELLALCEIECAENAVDTNIAGFGVKATHHRKGFGRMLLDKVLTIYDQEIVTVSTSRHNLPALNLYYSFGFIQLKKWEISKDIPMITLFRKPF